MANPAEGFLGRCARGPHKLAFTILLRSVSRLIGSQALGGQGGSEVRVALPHPAQNIQLQARRFPSSTSQRRMCRSLIFSRLAASDRFGFELCGRLPRHYQRQ
jgi:hypothetical protein